MSLRTVARTVGGRGEGAWGAAGAVCIWRKGGRVRSDGHFAARTAAALPAPPEGIHLTRSRLIRSHMPGSGSMIQYFQSSR